MKKHSILKAIGLVFLVYVILSWIIPGGSFSSGEFTKGTTAPLGIGDLFLYPIATSAYQMFILSGLVVLSVGGFYSILNKTGVFASMVEGMAKNFKKHSKLFLVLTTVFYALAAGVLDLTLPLFLLIPLSVAVIMSLGYDKIKAFLATFGAIIVGGIGCMIGSNMDGYNYVNYFLQLEIKDTVLYSLIVFVVSVGTLLFFVLRNGKNKKKKKEEDNTIPLYVKGKGAKKPGAATVIFTALIILVIVSMFNWSALGVTFFDNIHEKITTFTVNGNYTLFAHILGGISAFRYWGNFEFIMLTLMASMLIAWIYKVSASDAIDSYVEGVKAVAPAAIVVVMANILLYTCNSSSSPFYQSILHWFISMSKSFNYFVVAGYSIVGSAIYSSYPYLLYATYDPATVLYSSSLPMIALTMRAIYGIMSLIVPTSIMLVLGLRYLNISYKEWFKNAWILLVTLLVLVSATILIIAAVI